MYSKSVLFFLLLFLSAPFSLQAGEDVVGWVENVRLYPGNLVIKAKVDTGAQTSSLNCECSQTFQKDGEDWLRFTITDDEGNSHEFEKKVQRVAQIKRHFGESQERYVVNIDICLAGHRKTIEATVINREGFNYQMLIGRSAMAGDFLVNPAKTFMTKPHCN